MSEMAKGIATSEFTGKPNKDLYCLVMAELEEKGTLASAIEFDPEGNWVGVLIEKDISFDKVEDQVHFGKVVFNYNQRV